MAALEPTPPSLKDRPSRRTVLLANRPIILFDIDFTLIDTAKLKASICRRQAQLLSCRQSLLEKFQTAYTRDLKKSTNFNPRAYVSALARKYRYPQEPLLDLFFDSPELYRRALYPETVPALKKLRKVCRLGIFSEGWRAFQLTKLSQAGILKFFEPGLIFVHRRKLTPAVFRRLPADAYVVDDKIAVALALAAVKRLHPVWLNQESHEGRPDCPVIRGLIELPKILAAS